MKCIPLLFCLVFRAEAMVAQSNQISLYIQQIAANQVMIGYIQDGFRIAKFGLTTISDLKNGEFHLQTGFFNSLRTINPNIKKMAQVVDMIAMEVEIVKNSQAQLQRVNSSDAFTTREASYIHRVIDRLLADVGNTLNELYTVVTANQYQMSDDERINRITGLHAIMQNSLVFSTHFNGVVMMVAGNRREEREDIKMMKKLMK